MNGPLETTHGDISGIGLAPARASEFDSIVHLRFTMNGRLETPHGYISGIRLTLARDDGIHEQPPAPGSEASEFD